MSFAYKVEELLALRDSVSESAVSIDRFADEDVIKGELPTAKSCLSLLTSPTNFLGHIPLPSGSVFLSCSYTSRLFHRNLHLTLVSSPYRARFASNGIRFCRLESSVVHQQPAASHSAHSRATRCGGPVQEAISISFCQAWQGRKIAERTRQPSWHSRHCWR